MSEDAQSRSGGPGYDAFLSYHWRDRAQVEELARNLGDRGLRVFLDRWYLIPGLPWPQRLETALRDCRAVVVSVGAGEMGPWQQREAYVALERQVLMSARRRGAPAVSGAIVNGGARAARSDLTGPIGAPIEAVS